MAPRRCVEPGCKRYTNAGRCPEHTLQRDRPPAAARGYDANHRALRQRWATEVETGRVSCARCGDPITPDEPWDLGHDDQDRTRYVGPEHAMCNRSRKPRRPL